MAGSTLPWIPPRVSSPPTRTSPRRPRESSRILPPDPPQGAARIPTTFRKHRQEPPSVRGAPQDAPRTHKGSFRMPAYRREVTLSGPRGPPEPRRYDPTWTRPRTCPGHTRGYPPRAPRNPTRTFLLFPTPVPRTTLDRPGAFEQYVPAKAYIIRAATQFIQSVQVTLIIVLVSF